jgi:hypothetical protein
LSVRSFPFLDIILAYLIVNYSSQPKQLEQEAVWRWQGGLQEVETVSWDLKECNNRLVTYIDRARVLRQVPVDDAQCMMHSA